MCAAEMKPPLFDKHAMSALYQIVQRPPPALKEASKCDHLPVHQISRRAECPPSVHFSAAA